MNKSNTIASVLKGYAWINGFSGLIVSAFLLNERIDWILVFFVFAAILISSFIIYAVGEVVQILHDIRENTKQTISTVTSDELPDL